MFTEGLDESALKWVKQGSDVGQKVRSPLTERFGLDPVPRSPSFYNSQNHLSSQVLPPLKFHSGLLGHHTTATLGLDDDESVGSIDMDESAASVDMDESYSDECEGLGSSDSSDLFSKLSIPCCDQKPSKILTPGIINRDSSKENLRVDVPQNIRRYTNGGQRISTPNAINQSQEQGPPRNEVIYKHLADLGTPSAPPIIETGREDNKFGEEDNDWAVSNGDVGNEQAVYEVHSSTETWTCRRRSQEKAFNSIEEHSQRIDEPSASMGGETISNEVEPQLPYYQTNIADQQPPYYSTSGQNAWQTMVAYDACIRLCLHAWARGCTEAPEFLRDECLVLRSAFGLHKFLLQPKGVYPKEGRSTESADETCSVKAKKVVGKTRVEVKKVRIIPRRKLKNTYSHRGAVYIQVGADYVRHVSAMVKTGINSLNLSPFPLTSEEAKFSCLFQLKSTTEDTEIELGSAICLQSGTGDHHIFFPESQGDALLVEVQDANKVTHGRAIIKISSLTDNPSDKVRWWPLYHDDHECVGKVQLSIGSTITYDEVNPIKSGQVVETLAYDLVLESAMRAQHFHPRNLRIHGPWKWLLNNFADYFGVSDSYTKLRYLSYTMNVATPTKDCLELVYELLVPVVKARTEKCLTQQEKSILFDTETQVENLLAKVFENYKSLDDLSPTGLIDAFGPISESAAPALVPAVQVYTILHDILAQESQTILRNYLQATATKRCRRHMAETDEFMSSNTETLLMDPMSISTAYIKMKNLCLNISNEIKADINIHNQHILPSSIDLSNIASAVYNTQLFKRLTSFLAVLPPSSPSPHVTELLIATADFERDLDLWKIRPVHGGVDSRKLFHNYIMVWVEDKQLSLLDLCKAEKVPWSGVTTNHSTSPFAEDMYEKIKDFLIEYEVVINRWPQYSLILENAVAIVERAVIKALEKQYNDILTPLKDSIPKKLGFHVQKLTRRQSTTLYSVPNQLGIFVNTIKRVLDVLHCRVEDIFKPWASCVPLTEDKKSVFGEQLNGITVLLRTKYKNYMQATVEKLTQGNRSTRFKRILEDLKEADGEAEVREKMQIFCSQLMDSISNLHEVFTSQIFVTTCRGFWDRMGQTVLKFLESRKENRVCYNGSYYALGILDDTFASQMQRLQGNALQEKNLEPPRSVVEARSILCRDTKHTAHQSTYFDY
ncbi:hypothetical protein GIB67_008536 [Kingdonia uniflora]|uniref:Uncharacterized protein n=1 Tax=Kingdonia uniflora TaxID=39325 RepID=A0A7J7LFP2_9MAGN|nr:hypothetical protein GIB67_008536 [Kingdonia uniflora]